MKSAYEQINDLLILNSHNNEKYKTQLSSDAVIKLNILLRELRNIIRINYDSNNTTKKAQVELTKKLNTKLSSGLESIKRYISKELGGFMGVNQQLYYDQLTAVFSPVQKYIHIKKATKKDIGEDFEKEYVTFSDSGAHSVESMWHTFTMRLKSTINSATNEAYILEEELQDYEDNLFGTTGSTNISKNHLATLVATYVTKAFIAVTRQTDKANTAIQNGYVYVAVIDSATSAVCQDFHMEYYLYDAPEKSTLPYEVYPPQHFNCRSNTSPFTKSYQELGISAEELTQEQRELLSSPDIQPFSYNDFIESQPPSIQREILGDVRYSMYKSGEITIDKFYTRDRRKYSLSELQQKGYSISQEYLHYIRK